MGGRDVLAIALGVVALAFGLAGPPLVGVLLAIVTLVIVFSGRYRS